MSQRFEQPAKPANNFRTKTKPIIRMIARTHQTTVKVICKHVGAQIRSERERRGMLQSYVAEQLGVSLPTYRSLEAGRQTVSQGLAVSALVFLKLGDPLLAIAPNES